jgi:phosphoheptose isomerase
MTVTTPRTLRARDSAGAHLADLAGLEAELARNAGRIGDWGVELADRLLRGQRLLVAGNGGSAAEAQHLAAELVGRFQGERRAFSAIALTAETSSLTAIGNDYGYEQVFARQVEAHGRAGDVLMLLSTSGRSPNLIAAAAAARRDRLTVWAMTGAGPNPLTEASDDAVVLATSSPHAQEGHLIAVHALCRAFDAAIAAWQAGEAP